MIGFVTDLLIGANYFEAPEVINALVDAGAKLGDPD